LIVSPAALVERYLNGLQDLLASIEPAILTSVVERIAQARDQGRTVYIAGNGGSAATAAHVANDFGKATRRSGRRPIRAMCLSDNISWLTALANDEGYDRVFAGQLENFAEAGDVLIVISASGNSANLLRAVALAQSLRVFTIGVLGFDGGKLKDLVDEALWLPSPIGLYGPVESAHSVVLDIITTCLAEDRTPGNSE
jgi:D-sedoheptulose 7-phosphate isomerase